MTEVPFTAFAYSRENGYIASRLVNLVSEASPQGPNEDERIPRPGLVSTFQWGSGPIRALFRKAGAFGGGKFAVSGGECYLDGVDVGPIPGTDLVRFAASKTQVVAVSAGVAYLFEGVSFAPITNANLPLASDVKYFGERFVYSVLGSDRNYYSEINDAANIDGLSFFTSESSADPETAVEVLGDEMFMFGVDSTEIWSVSDDLTAPYQRNTGRKFERGCASRDTVSPSIDNALFWVGDDRIVYRSESVPKRVSTHGIEDKLRQCEEIASCTGWGQVVDRHAGYLLNIPGVGSFMLDIQTGNWSEWQSYGRDTFRGHVACAVDGVVFVGDDVTNDIWTLTPGVYTDGTDPMVRIVSCFYVSNSRFERCDRLSVISSKGVGNNVDPGSDPVIEMRYSDDQAATFSDWRQASIGRIGEYRKRALWRRLGAIRAPGRYFEFRCSDPVLAVFQTVFMNEPG